MVNRISNGTVNVENKVYSLSINDKDCATHFNGGFAGFDNVNWNSYVMKKHVVRKRLNTRISVPKVAYFFEILFRVGDVSFKSSKQRRISRKYVNAN